MSVANYWFGTEHEMALYQIIGGGRKNRSGTSRDPNWLREHDSVCELLRRAWRSCCVSLRFPKDGGADGLSLSGEEAIPGAQLLPPRHWGG